MMNDEMRQAPGVTAAAIQRQTQHKPVVALVLGSGLSELADTVEDADVIDYDALPHWPVSTVVGHSGRLVIGQLEGQAVMILQGRAHFYEGYSMSQITLPVRVMQQLGIRTLILTNAAGGLNPDYRPGQLMLIKDHLNLVGMAGHNPLRGPNDDQLGPRFPDMTFAYDLELRELARRVADEAHIRLHEGVYAYLGGPNFETPAEVRFLRLIGADAVGMSTVPAVLVARHAGMRVMGLSAITNAAHLEPEPGAVTSHEEVLEVGQRIIPQLTQLLRGVLGRIQ